MTQLGNNKSLMSYYKSSLEIKGYSRKLTILNGDNFLHHFVTTIDATIFTIGCQM